MGTVPCSPCPLLWLPMGRGPGCDVAHQRNPWLPDLIQMSSCERLKTWNGEKNSLQSVERERMGNRDFNDLASFLWRARIPMDT